MEHKRVLIDTHILLWYIHKDSRSLLSKKALETIRFAENHGIIYVPMIVLSETLHLIEKGKVPQYISFEQILTGIENHINYEIVPMDLDVLKASIPFRGLEIHDRLIVATTIVTNSMLITYDRRISESIRDRIIW